MAILALGYAIHFTPRSWEQNLKENFEILWPAGKAAVAIAAAALCWRLGAGETLSFVYYKF